MDIETRFIENVITPICLCYYDGINSFSYYLEDFKNNVEDMLINAILSLIKKEYNGHIIYVHNLSNFDYIFLIKVLFDNFNIIPKFKENKVISLIYKHKTNNIKIELLDSYLILLSSLRTLALKYKVEDQKGIFPYSFVNEYNFNSIGIVP